MNIQPLEVEISGIFGWHDGEKVNMSEHAINNEMVVHHERVHANIFHNTPDGELLSVCMKFSDKLLTQKERDLAKNAIRSHINSARIAHESAATYIGIKMLKDVQSQKKATVLLQNLTVAIIQIMMLCLEMLSSHHFYKLLLHRPFLQQFSLQGRLRFLLVQVMTTQH